MSGASTTTAGDGFGARKSDRLAAKRQADREAVQAVKLNPDFPYEVEPVPMVMIED